MDILEWPDGIRPSSMDWKLVSNGSSFVSKFNGATQTIRYPGSMWSCDAAFDDLDDYESRHLETTLFSLDGMSGRIKMPDFGRWGRPAFGTPLVSGAGQSGMLLNTQGWHVTRLVLERGDYITVNNELKIVLADVWSSSTGTATVKIAPMLRNSPDNLAAIETLKPYGIFRLAKDENGVSRKPAFTNSFSLNFIEAF